MFNQSLPMFWKRRRKMGDGKRVLFGWETANPIPIS